MQLSFIVKFEIIIQFEIVCHIRIGITSNKPWHMQNFTMVLGNEASPPGFKPQTMVKFCIYHGWVDVISIITDTDVGVIRNFTTPQCISVNHFSPL